MTRGLLRAVGAERKALAQALNFIREGDQLVITRFDRLARSVLDLSRITAEIAAKKVVLVLDHPSISATRPAVCCSTCWPPSASSRAT